MKRASRWAPFSRKHIFTTPTYCMCPEQYDLMASMTLGAPGFLPGKVNLIPSSSQMPGSSWLTCAKTFRRNSDGIELCKLHIAQLIFAALVKQGTCKRPGDLLLEVFLLRSGRGCTVQTNPLDTVHTVHWTLSSQTPFQKSSFSAVTISSSLQYDLFSLKYRWWVACWLFQHLHIVMRHSFPNLITLSRAADVW